MVPNKGIWHNHVVLTTMWKIPVQICAKEQFQTQGKAQLFALLLLSYVFFWFIYRFLSFYTFLCGEECDFSSLTVQRKKKKLRKCRAFFPPALEKSGCPLSRAVKTKQNKPPPLCCFVCFCWPFLSICGKERTGDLVWSRQVCFSLSERSQTVNRLSPVPQPLVTDMNKIY